MAGNNEIEVVIGARIDQLNKAVGEVKDQLGSINDVAQNVNKQFGFLERIDKRFRDVAGAISATISDISHWAREMGEAGLAAERMYLTTGLTGEAMLTLKAAAALSGTEIHDLVQSLSRSSLQIQKSTADAFNPAAQALKVLGLNAKEMIGLPLDKYYLKLSEAVSNFAPGINRMNALQSLGMRNIQELMPVLDIGKEKLTEFKEAYEKAGAGAGVSIKAFASTRLEFILLDKTIESFGKVLFSVAQGPINYAIKTFREFVQSFSKEDIQEGLKTLLDWILWFSSAAIELFNSVKDSVTSMMAKFDSIRNWSIDLRWIPLLGDYLDKMGGTEVKSDNAIDKIGESAKKVEGLMPGFVSKMRTQFEELKRIMDESSKGFGGVGGGDRPQVAAMDFMARQNLQLFTTQINTQIMLSKGLLDEKKADYERDAQFFAISEREKISLLRIAMTEQFNLEQEKLKKLKSMQPTAAEAAAVNQQILQGQIKFNADMTALYDKMAIDIKNRWEGITGSFTSSWATSIGQLIGGAITLRQAFAQSMQAMFNAFMQMIAKMVAEWAAAQLAQVTLSILGEKAKTAAATEGAGARLGILALDAIKSIGTSIAQIFAELTAWLAPIFGPAAPAAALGIATGVGATAIGMVESFDKGSWSVPYDMLAMVHAGERITPAGVQGGGWQDNKGGGGATNVIIHALDARSVAAWAHENAGALAAAVTRHHQNNPSTRGRY